MLYRSRCFLWLLLLFLVIGLSGGGAVVLGQTVLGQTVLGQTDEAAGRAAAECLPSETLIYLEVPAPHQLTQKLLHHPTVAAALELDAVKPNLRGPQLLAFRAGLALVEGTLGKEWPELVTELGGNGLVLGVLPGENRVVALLNARDEERLKKAAESLLNLSALDARNKGIATPYRIESRGDAKIAIFDGFAMARSGSVLVLATRTDDTEAVLTQMASMERANSLAKRPAFQVALKNLKNDQHELPDVLMWVNLEEIRQAGIAPALSQSVSDNPAAELLFGGLLASLQSNDWATATLQLSNESLRLEMATEYQPEVAIGHREYWFGEAGQGEAPRWIPTDSQAGPTVLRFSTYRDLGQWWLSKESLFTDSVIADLVQADSQLSTVFGGLDFGGEILGAFEPGVEILVSGHPGSNLDEGVEQAAGVLHIPGFAIVGQLRDPRQMTRRFKVAFQSVMGFVNLGLSQAGLPQYDVDTRTTEQGCECLSRIWVEDDADLESPVYSFSPSLIVQDGRFILGSDSAWVQRLANSPIQAATVPTAQSTPTEPSGAVSEETLERHLNTELWIDWRVLVDLLRLNREALIAQNMVENGNNRSTAGREVEQLLQALELVSHLEFKIETDPEQLRLLGEIKWGSPPSSSQPKVNTP